MQSVDMQCENENV